MTGNKQCEKRKNLMNKEKLDEILEIHKAQPVYGIDTFSVYSSALGKHMKYNLKDNEITVE
ncbi:MAG: hypothetical protein LBQ22_04655 [Bacteroidales bacterium]|jgi:hypothetical protein|nr:hypothetical protein [Bacteroidales bacterium]